LLRSSGSHPQQSGLPDDGSSPTELHFSSSTPIYGPAAEPDARFHSPTTMHYPSPTPNTNRTNSPRSPRRRHRCAVGETFPCPHASCTEVFVRPCDLKKHRKKHTRPYKCKLCPQDFYQRRDLEKHTRVHVGGPSWPCPYENCGKKYTVDDNLVRHIKKEHGVVVQKSSLQHT